MKVVQNPDKEYADVVKQKLKENHGYCPCRLQKTEDTKCMCKEFRKMMSKNKKGTCHCGLYIIEEDN